MVKRIFQGVGLLIVLALVVIAVSVVRFDKTKDELAAKYAGAPSQFIELPSGAVAHVRDQGNMQGPALVLIHGSNASLHTWEPWVALLGAKYRIVTMDMPGHGLTGAVPGDDYSRAGMVAFTHEVLQKLGVAHYAIGGNSMGGGVAAQYAEDYPGEVTALILVDAAGLPRERQPGEKIPLGFRLAQMPVLNKIMLYVSPRSIFAEGVRKVFVDQSKVTEEMIDRYYDLNLYDGNRKATGIRFRYPPTDQAVAEKLGQIAVPVLVLWGEKDGLIPVANAYEFQKRISGAKVVVYPDVGHIPMEEVPERSAADVDSFLAAALAPKAAAPVETAPVHHDGKVEIMPVSPE
ncbi:MAG: alpha/beta hydrolase [Parvibaculum sp.]|uniref:alpha/beta fold hydrolase n=1 Tax=Parvibaculum sp. TaxID=2024848 RepID=UPI0025CCB98F|nr:alpha/beta hydrolase [Parvibaculum sp.]MCE9648299.1 alpha/beta hydrolase [Parvibaculum sp.]